MRHPLLLVFMLVLACSFTSYSFASGKKTYIMNCFVIGDVAHLRKSIESKFISWKKRWKTEGLVSAVFDFDSGSLVIETKNKSAQEYCFADLKRRFMEIHIQLYRSLGL